MGIQKRHISSYSAHANGRVEKPNQSLANILASISQNTNDWDEQLPHTMLALNSAIHEATYTSPFFLEHGRDIRLSYTYEKNSDTPQNKYEYVEKLLPSLEHTFNKVLNNLKDQEASHVELSTRATKQHHYDYKIGSLCFIKTPNIKSNLSPKLRPKFEGPYRVIERFSNVNYRVQHVEQLRKRFNTHANRMIPFIKRFSYLHLKNLDDLQPDETEVKGIVPGPRYNLRARAATRGLLATDHVILNHGQVTWTTPELAPPLLTTTPHQREDVSALDRFNVHRCPTRRVFSGTGIELMTCLPWLDTLTTGLPQPQHLSERLGIRHVMTVVYRPQANRTERVNRDLVQMIANYVNEQHDTGEQFLREFAYAIRTAVNEMRKTPVELFLSRKLSTPFQKLVMVSDGTDFAVGDIERLFEEARRNTKAKHMKNRRNIIIDAGVMCKLR
ncbi:integrase catalytic domain-containing protein [Trichonephila clavipes]|nr:integrase catalytic domain-containing protein [Trichonephila clavipes]